MKKTLSLIAMVTLGSWIGVEAYVVMASVFSSLAPHLGIFAA